MRNPQPPGNGLGADTQAAHLAGSAACETMRPCLSCGHAEGSPLQHAPCAAHTAAPSTSGRRITTVGRATQLHRLQITTMHICEYIQAREADSAPVNGALLPPCQLAVCSQQPLFALLCHCVAFQSLSRTCAGGLCDLDFDRNSSVAADQLADCYGVSNPETYPAADDCACGT